MVVVCIVAINRGRKGLSGNGGSLQTQLVRFRQNWRNRSKLESLYAGGIKFHHFVVEKTLNRAVVYGTDCARSVGITVSRPSMIVRTMALQLATVIAVKL
jgi:hypothetical protein